MLKNPVAIASLAVLLSIPAAARASVEFDSMTWYDSHSPSTMFINAQGHLEWVPYNDHQIIVRIPDQDLSDPGDVVEIAYYWLSDGQANLPDCDDCTADGCNFNKDITCVSGTGDFRVGLFESDSNYVTADGLGVSNDIFRGYKGYKFCMQPHVDPNVVRWVEPSGEPHISGGFYERDMIDDPRLLSVNEVFDRISMYGGCGLPLGRFSLWVIRLERLSADSIGMSFMLNGITYTDIDTTNSDPAWQPNKIDVFAIEFPNPNPYSRMVLARPEDVCSADFNLDGVVDEKDLAVLTCDWLERSYWDSGAEPDANCLEMHYSFDGIVAAPVPSGLVDDTATYAASIIPGSNPDSTIIYAEPEPVYNTGASAEFTNDDWTNDAGDTFLVPDTAGLDFSTFDEFTVELFANPSSAGSGRSRRLFSEYINAFMYVSPDNTLQAYRKWATGDNWDSYTTRLEFPDFPHDTWSHVAMTWHSAAQGDRFKLYVDGQLVDGATGNSTLTLDSSAGFAIGGYQRENNTTAQFFSGKIDAFKLHRCALSQSQIIWSATAGHGATINLDSRANLYEDDSINFRDFAKLAEAWLRNCL